MELSDYIQLATFIFSIIGMVIGVIALVRTGQHSKVDPYIVNKLDTIQNNREIMGALETMHKDANHTVQTAVKSMVSFLSAAEKIIPGQADTKLKQFLMNVQEPGEPVQSVGDSGVPRVTDNQSVGGVLKAELQQDNN